MGIIETPDKPVISASDAENKPPQSPQSPPSAPAAPAAPPDSKAEQAAVAVATSLQTKLGNWLKDVYDSNKILFYTIIPLMGLIYLVIKFHNVLIDILLGTSKEILQKEKEKDAALAQQAAQTKSEADALVKKAQDAPGQEGPVDNDWDKK